MRALALVPGMALAAWCLAGTLRAGQIDDRSRYRWLFMLAGLHIAATLFFFPAEHLFDARPVVTADHAIHYGQCLRSKTVFWQTARLDCYSPYFMAGYPAGTIFDLDMKGAELFTALVPIHTATALKLFILVAYLSMLPAVYRGARMLGFRLDEALFGVMLLLAYWHWGRPYAGDFRYVGMFSFVFATHAVIYVAGLWRRFLAGEGRIALFVLGPISFLVHVLSVVMSVVPIVTVLVADRARLTRRRIELLLLWVLGVVFVNALWIVPLFRFLPYKTPTDAYFQVRGIAHLARVLVEPSGLIAISVLGLAMVGAGRLRAERRTGVGAPLGMAAAVMLVFAAYGVFIPGIDQLEPGRFLLSAIVFAAPLAGSGGVWILHACAARLAPSRAAMLRATAMIALALAPVPLAMLDAKAYYRHTLEVDLPPRVERLVGALAPLLRVEGRLLIEEGSEEAYDGLYLPALLPTQTRVEQIGGPYPHVPLLFHRTTFNAHSLLGRPFASWQPDDALDRLHFLRVRWAVTATDEATRFVAALPGVVPRWEEGRLHIWELPPARMPGVPVRAAYNHIEADVAAGSRPVVLPYHWVEGVRANEGNEIVPVLREDDPIPFICVWRASVTPVIIRY